MANNNKKTIISHPQVAVVMVILTIQDGVAKVLLYEREREPIKLSLPAGLIYAKESLDAAALRVLKEKTGIKRLFLEQLYTFGDPNRDPYKRTIGVAYYSLLNYEDIKVREKGAGWYPVKEIGELAFDHNKILKTALARTRSKMMYSNIMRGVLPSEFSLTQLQNAYEALIYDKFDKRNFRKKMLSLNILESSNKKMTGKKHRPAMLFKFKNSKTVLFKSKI